jgi:Uma2 family endonuclease
MSGHLIRKPANGVALLNRVNDKTMNTYTINFNSIFQLIDDQFYQLCRNNPDIKFERNAKGEIIIMPPTGGETGKRNAEIAADFVIWNRQTKLGVVFDSSTCFKLPNGAVGEASSSSFRSPDVAWIKQERWDTLTAEQKEKFPPIAPDFILELMFPTDPLKETQGKLQEYLDNQVKLGWLIAPKTGRVEIYRQGKVVEVLTFPATLSGEDILPGFVLDLQIIWQ